MNANNLIEIMIGLTALVSFVYRLSQLEAKLYRTIHTLEDKLYTRINHLDNKFAIHVADYSAKKEWQDYQIHGLHEKVDHKFDRCWDEIKELKNNE
jgi:hypothetical protein